MLSNDIRNQKCSYPRSEWLRSKPAWSVCHHREGRGTVSLKYGDGSTRFQTLSPGSHSQRCTWIKWGKGTRSKPQTCSFFICAQQESPDMNVGNILTKPPDEKMQGEGALLRYVTVQQAPLNRVYWSLKALKPSVGWFPPLTHSFSSIGF